MPHATTADIGATLRSAREDLGISVEEAAWRTRIKPDYLRALEEERFEEIGHHAVARGHLHSYARHLGLEADALARAYRERFEHTQPSPIERLNEQVKESKRPPKPKWLIAALLSTAVLVAASLTGVVRGPGPRTTPAGDTLATLPASAEAQPTAQPTGVAPVAPAAPASPVSIVLAAQGRSWIRAVVDGTLVFEGVVPAGTTKTFNGTEKIDVVIGNAGVVRLTVNGKVVPAGRSGAVYRASFGPRGLIAPQ